MKSYLMLFVLATFLLVFSGCSSSKCDCEDPTVCMSDECSSSCESCLIVPVLTAFSFTSPVSAYGTIDQTTKQISVEVPCGTDLSDVTGAIAMTAGASISPDIRMGISLSNQSQTFRLTLNGNTSTYVLTVTTSTDAITRGLPSFANTRPCVGAASYTSSSVRVSQSEGRMFLFDCNSSEMVSVSRDNKINGPWLLSKYGPDNTHPFRNQGIGAALHIRSDTDPARTYFFNRAGTVFTGYSIANGTFFSSIPLWKWGTDYSCPFQAVGAAMDASVGTREIACLFNKEGTQYTLYESGTFSSPRSIQSLQIRNSDEPVAVPFSSVGAAMRLDVSNRVVFAIFNGAGDEYVYVEMGKNCVPGPYSI